MALTPGTKMMAALAEENPLQVVGTINAYTALLAKGAGFRALYLSGAGVANASFGLPDLGMTTLSEVLEETRRITGAVSRLCWWISTRDSGAGFPFRTVQEMIRAGAAAVHMEDQVQAKRCGHSPGKELVSPDEMVDRIKAAVDAKTDPSFILMARTDAHSVEGLEPALYRACRYVEAGAD